MPLPDKRARNEVLSALCDSLVQQPLPYMNELYCKVLSTDPYMTDHHLTTAAYPFQQPLNLLANEQQQTHKGDIQESSLFI